MVKGGKAFGGTGVVIFLEDDDGDAALNGVVEMLGWSC